jgi:hypothetical protein
MITSPTISVRLRPIARAAAFWVILVGCLVLVGGWGFNSTLLKSGILGAANMKANTALAFILAGISLGLHNHVNYPLPLVRSTKAATDQWSQLQFKNQFRSIAQVCAIGVLLIGFLTLLQYILGWNLGIDQLLVQDQGSGSSEFPGRMGDNTALNFTFMGAALWLLGQKTRRSIQIAEGLTLAAAAIALLALIGHVYGVETLYRFIVYSALMAWHTALMFLVPGFY